MSLARALGTLIGTGAGLAAAAAFYAWREAKWVQTTETVVAIPDLPQGLDGLRILHISDTHFPADGESVPRFLDTVERLQYDITLMTGDYVETAAGWSSAVRAFRALRPGLGIYASLGAHDRTARPRSFWDGVRAYTPIPGVRRRLFVDPSPFVQALEDAGVTVLRNEQRSLEIAGELLRLSAVDDAWIGLADLDGALPGAGAEPQGFHVLLSHSPDALLDPRTRSVPLALCGHTHGGQIRVPFYGAPVRHSHLVDRVRTAGLHRIAHTQVVISRGFGTAALPLRLGCRPEIGVIELRRS